MIVDTTFSEKSVALVGPAKYMLNSGLGEEIDSHDIVVRINRGIESSDTYPEDLGKRTDLFYSCMIERAQQTGKLDVEDLVERGVQRIFVPPNSDMQGFSLEDVITPLASRETINKIVEKIPLFVIPHEFNNAISSIVKCKPNTGFLSIYDLIRQKPEKLSIYGFSFYLDGFIPGQKLGVENEGKGSEQEFANLAFKSKRHIQVNMWRYAKDTLFDKPNGVNVHTDRVLTQILQMEEFSKENFQKNVNLDVF